VHRLKPQFLENVLIDFQIFHFIVGDRFCLVKAPSDLSKLVIFVVQSLSTSVVYKSTLSHHTPLFCVVDYELKRKWPRTAI